jgi:hypothetical protein
MPKWSGQRDSMPKPAKTAESSTEPLSISQQPDETSFPAVLGRGGSGKQRPVHLMRDPRREVAQMEAKARWASWARNKAL